MHHKFTLPAKQILICITQVLCVVSFAQTKTIDSLKTKLINAKDTQQVNILNRIAELYFQQASNRYDSNLTRSAEFAHKALQLAEKINNTKETGIALFNTGNVLSFKEELHNAVSIFKQAIPFLKEAGENKTLGSCLKILAECIHELGDNEQAIKYYDTSFAVFQKLNDTSGLILSLEWKGHSYFDIGDYKNAYQYGYQALGLAQKVRDTLAQIQTADHLANLFLGAAMPETVLEYMRIIPRFYPNTFLKKEVSSWEVFWGLLKAGEAYLQLGKVDSAMLVAQITGFYGAGAGDHNMFLGDVFVAHSEYLKALPYFKDGLYLSSKSEHIISVARHANGLSRVYLATGNYDSALYYANKAIHAAQSIHALLEWKNAIGSLINIYDKTKNYTKAYHFSKLYKAVSDSLAPEEYKRKLSLIQIQQELENKKQEAEFLAKGNQQQLLIQHQQLKSEALIRNVLIGSMLFVLALGIFIFRSISLKRKNESLQSEKAQADLRQKATDLEMQALRAQMNPHLIFNCLSSINRFILINKTEEASDYLTKFSRLIRMVLHNSEKSFITLENEIEALRLYLDLERLRFKNLFSYSITFIDTFDITSVFIPPLLLQPFVENAIWHGLQSKNDGSGKISIDIRIQNNILQCVICDNGIGRSVSLIKEKDITKKSLGINLTRRRLQLIDPLKQNETSVEFQDIKTGSQLETGTCVYIKIPVNYAS